jgi:predicted enzyme related to lactoylglutathione lyase
LKSGRDSEKSGQFFSSLFGWKIQPVGPAAIIDTGAGGINGHITALGHEPHNYVTIYVQVDELQEYLDKAVELGGKTLVPPVEIPTGSFAWLADPDGNVIGCGNLRICSHSGVTASMEPSRAQVVIVT